MSWGSGLGLGLERLALGLVLGLGLGSTFAVTVEAHLVFSKEVLWV